MTKKKRNRNRNDFIYCGKMFVLVEFLNYVIIHHIPVDALAIVHLQLLKLQLDYLNSDSIKRYVYNHNGFLKKKKKTNQKN